MSDQEPGRVFAYVGNFRIDGQNLGIAICDYQPATGALVVRERVFTGISVGSTYLDESRGILYCTDERSDNPDIGPGGGGRLFALKVDAATGELTEINRESSYGSLASFVATDASATYLVATNHARPLIITTTVRDASGSYRVIPVADQAATVLYRLGPDGAIGPASDVFRHEGRGPAPAFHPPAGHCVVFSPDGAFFVVCDKGTDELLTFRIDSDSSSLVLLARLHESPGSGPRYARFHPTAPVLYVCHENEPFISVYRYGATGSLAWVADVDVLDPEIPRLAAPQQSDLCLTGSGGRLYVLVRGVNVVSVFDVDTDTGALVLLQNHRLDADNPRGCALSPDERFLLVASVGTADVATLEVGADGRLSDTGRRSSFDRPGNVTFYTPPSSR